MATCEQLEFDEGMERIYDAIDDFHMDIKDVIEELRRDSSAT